MVHTHSIQYTLHTSDYIPEIITIPAKTKESKYNLCDIFTSNQSHILECNEISLLYLCLLKNRDILLTIKSVVKVCLLQKYLDIKYS